jgi:hypothetical protein
MYFARLRRFSQTLRFRLTVWNLVVIVVSALITLLGVRQGVQRAILHEIDQILIEDLLEIRYKLVDSRIRVADIQMAQDSLWSSEGRRLLEDLDHKARGHERHGWFVELREEEGGVLWSSDGAPDRFPGLPAVPDLQPWTQAGFRMVQRREAVDSGPALLVRVGAATEFLERDMARIDRLVALAVLAMAMVAPPHRLLVGRPGHAAAGRLDSHRRSAAPGPIGRTSPAAPIGG